MPRAPGDKLLLGALDARAASRLVATASDIALVLDDTGTILDVHVQGDDAAARRMREWRGRPWVQTVTVESRQKIEQLIADAQAAVDAQSSRWRQVNHPLKDGDDLPLLYAVVRLDDGDAPAADAPPRKKTAGTERAAGVAGAGAASGAGRILAIGRDLRAMVALQKRLVETQQAMERDYWRFREAETRYRHLLETSAEAVLVVDGATQKVLEANPAARALCGGGGGGAGGAGARGGAKLAGAALATVFDDSMAGKLQDVLAAARSVGRKDPVPALLADGSTEVAISASVFRQESATFVLVRLLPLGADAGTGASNAKSPRRRGLPSDGETDWASTFSSYVQAAPDGLVFCDATGRVLSANRAYLALAELSAEEQARGQPLDRWLGRTGVELGVLITNLRQRGSVGRFVTVLRGEYGTEVEVEIAAAQLTQAEHTLLAFAIRDIERRLKGSPEPGNGMARSPSELAELVGRTPLKDIVAETTDLIEQLCIETALAMSNDNRASAAQLLGLSRQSLYVKLRRYGLSGAVGEGDASD